MITRPAAWRPLASPRVQRAFDLAVAIPVTIVLAPLIALIACAIWVESGRPVLFRQVRLGQGGRPFVMLKFRKFAPDAPAGSALTRQHDPRMTVLGRILMATKLDELPQLWNVIKGEMAIVGPRPESLAFADCFKGGLERVLDHKPGLLGPCQILFRDEGALFSPDMDPERFYREVLFQAKAHIDLAYFERRTLFGDIGLLLRGVAAVIIPSAPQLPSVSPRALTEGGSAARTPQLSGLPSRALIEGTSAVWVGAPDGRGAGEAQSQSKLRARGGRKGSLPTRYAPPVILQDTKTVQPAQRS